MVLRKIVTILFNLPRSPFGRALDIMIGLLVIFVGYSLISWFTVKAKPSYAVFLPSGIDVIFSLKSLALDPDFWSTLASTFFRIMLSLCATILTGLIIGILLGAHGQIFARLRPAWDFLRSIPPSTLFPLIVLFFGIENQAKIITTFYFATLLYSFGVAEAARSAACNFGPFFRLVGVTRPDWYLRVLLPVVLLKSVSTLKLVVSLTVILMIVCEMFLGAVTGVGGAIMAEAEALRYSKLLALIAVAGFIGYGFNLLFQIIEDIARRRSQ